MFEGVFPALITPFLKNAGKDLDVDGLRSNIAFLVDSGVHGLVPCGSTGESATLSFAEHEKVVEITLEEAKGKVPVLAGTGSNNTTEAIKLTKAAKNAGADGVLVISPYYNKPNRSGLIKHYHALADLDIPVIIYNVPGRTGQNLAPDLISELAKHPGIAGIKEASGDINQISSIIELTRDEDFAVISGDDNMTLPIMSLGGTGVISVAANIFPVPMIAMYNAMKKGDWETARDIHYQLSPLFKAMFIESNPIPIKKAVELRGMAAGPVRLPLDEASGSTVQKLKEVLARYD
ncbi:MAG: 4-hydroxy-tetrahydrodipicolinate synthase [Methanospirillum sp.]|uniref:4-hydroxy-tetrahydrodipicolinate synthase n=1 Tax=Methanospirillum sp. TaxID=45200 RepID=UPI00236BF0A9|nr:4-hydroxy-tetrahydrodipicolinate synthase [Methanospirillum sp.]MDD1729194.1 4-hydroxy-tetrahydrodipicolinate synthase [Methanospirillum sp.]